MQKISRIVIPVDKSQASQIAMEQATYFAKLLKVDVSVITVDESQQYMVSALLQKKVIEEREHLLSDIKAFAEKNGVQTTTKLMSGNPAKEILKHVNSEDLIVMASQGKTGFNKFMLGSISEEVLRHAPCSVMIIKPQEENQTQSFIEQSQTSTTPE